MEYEVPRKYTRITNNELARMLVGKTIVSPENPDELVFHDGSRLTLVETVAANGGNTGGAIGYYTDFANQDHTIRRAEFGAGGDYFDILGKKQSELPEEERTVRNSMFIVNDYGRTIISIETEATNGEAGWGLGEVCYWYIDSQGENYLAVASYAK